MPIARDGTGRRVAINWRLVALFASGILVGGIAAGWAVVQLMSPAVPATPAARAPAGTTVAATSVPKPKAEASALRQYVACPSQPLIPAVSKADGQLRLQAGSSDVAASILAGKEAAASGRLRDAEVSFLIACGAADQSGRAESMAPADARYQLGRHYANVALSNQSMRGRIELLKRAEILYTDSLGAYRDRHGEGHEKTHFAAEGLAMVRQVVAPGVQPAPAAPQQPVQVATPKEPARPVAQAKPVAPPAVVAPARPRPRQDEPAEMDAPVRQATGEASQRRQQQARPSFDCNKARSPSERAICSDSLLAQLDRDLGRLHARARNSAADAAAFRRQNDQEWRRRESSCRGDRECLLNWYANRRDQLLDDIADAR